MRRPLLGAFVGVASLGVLMACNALTGVSDLLTVEGFEGGRGAGEGGIDPTKEGGGALDASIDGEVIDPTIPVVTPSLASCGADSICVSNTSGWTPALYLEFGFSNSTCPPAWPQTTKGKTSGGGSCGCDCTPKEPTACAGSLTQRGGQGCLLPPSTVQIASDGGCTATPEGGVPAPIAFTTTGTPPSACSAAVVDNLRQPRDIVTCAGVTPDQGSCASSELCVPKAPKGQFGGVRTGVVCIAHDGQGACPKNLPQRIVTGTAIVEGRSCSASCGCVPSDCKDGTIQAFSLAGCSASQHTFTVDGMCDQAGASSAMSFKYTPATGCAVAQKASTLGAETVQSPRTFCCQNIF